MLPTWAADTIIRIRPTTKTVRGSEMHNWNNTDELRIPGCSVQPAGTSLTEDGRVQGVSDGYTCYAPPTADIIEGDRIRFGGNVYTINGIPRLWTSPTGRVSHLLLNLERWDG